LAQFDSIFFKKCFAELIVLQRPVSHHKTYVKQEAAALTPLENFMTAVLAASIHQITAPTRSPTCR